MSVRSSMQDLIARVRSLIQDTDTSAPAFQDEEIQDALDLHRADVRYEQLQSLPTIVAGGSVSYLTHTSKLAFWEADAALVDLSFAPVTPASGGSDPMNGRWTLSESCWTVMIVGKTYDVYRTAADLLEEWILKKKDDNDFTVDRRSFSDNQSRVVLQSLVKLYRRKQRVLTGRMITTDTVRDR